jgi:hypothetical protein
MNEVGGPKHCISGDDISPGIRSPFVGTRPFSADDAAFFFGRERDAARLANLIVASTLTVLYGTSGVGKSSLINARLPHALNDIEPDWLVIPFYEWQPGCLTRLEQTIEKATGVTITDGLARTLLGFAGRSGRPVLLVLDQFEEYFLYHPQGLNALDAELAKLINRRVSQVRILFSLRSDGLFLLDQLRMRIPHIFGSMMSIEALDERAAVDCVVRPLEAYNGMLGTAAVQVPERSSDLVKVLVSGADEERILLRLPGRGRSELEKDERRAARIVVPFLQMALDALWQEDVVNMGRDHLDLGTLRQLAELAEHEESSQAVGALAQKYVDSILRDFSSEEKVVCALVLGRMVLPSGQKVAVKLVDLNPALTDAQQTLAVSVLARLSAGQTRRLIKMVAGPRDSEPHYQIVHDAMAIPLLGWVEQWKNDERAACARAEAEEEAERERAAEAAKAARARRRGAIAAALLGIIAIAITVWIGNRYTNVKLYVDRLATVADNDPRPGFRLPLLLSVAAFSEAGWWPIKADLNRVLRRRLLQSPRDGGTFSAVGFDPEHSRVTWISSRLVVVCDLREAKDCDPASENSRPLYTLLLPEDWDYSESRNPRLRQNLFSSIGFVAGIDGPVLYRRGLVYHQVNDEWIRDDIADMLPDLDLHQGGIFVEILGGGLKVTISDWPNGHMWATRLVADPGPAKRLVRESVPDKGLNVTWPIGQSSPIVSTGATYAAYVFSHAAGSGQWRRSVYIAHAGELTAKKPLEEPLETIKEVEFGKVVGLASTRPGLGFTADSQFLAALHRKANEEREIALFDLSRYPIVTRTHFHVDASIPRYPPQGNPFSFPPVAAARLPTRPEAKAETWRFAWLTQVGVRVLEGDAGGSALRNWSLLPGIQNASRLDFSTDGEFLVLQWLNFDRANVAVRIWDLGPSWRERIEKSTDFATLRQLACRVAAIQTGHSSLEPIEVLEWQVQSQPCGQDGAGENSD